MNIIEVKNIYKSFDNLQALDGLDFQVKRGEIYGLLGPNGAGKSTTINILSGLLSIDNGEVLINEYSLMDKQHKVKELIGVVPQEIALYDEMSAFDNLMFWGSLYAIPKKKLKQKVQETLELLGLSDRQKEPINNFSGGMKRRINIGAAILHQPKILLMDEPTVGIDPQSRNHIFELIEKLNKDGLTIIYSTHYMEEAERLCHTIGIIDKGKIIVQGSLADLKNMHDVPNAVILQLKHINQAKLDATKINYKLLDINKETMFVSIPFQDVNTDIPQIINTLQQSGADILSLKTQSVNLEDIFLKLTGKQLRD